MNFINAITEKENEYLKKLKECKENGLRTYILGNGEGADNTQKRAFDFCFAGRLVNKQYYKPEDNVYCLEEFFENATEKINIVVAYSGFEQSSIACWESKISILIVLDCFAANYYADPSIMTYEFITKNKKKLEKVFSEFEDDYSREVFVAYINQKISMNYKHLRKVITSPQYFEEIILPLSEEEVFLDCGAYTGDSALSFKNMLKYYGILKYKKIISFEPDPENYEKLKNIGIENHECINKGVSDCKEELYFNIRGTSSGAEKDGEIKVEIDTIDNMVKEKVTLIKMDIEGMELAALKGCKRIILEHKPKMAISIYHKKEDLWEIQEYIKSLVPDYKFYVRAYAETATELILYAIR